MKLTFLGTGHGVPAADRFCSCIMLEVGESIYLIDIGAPAVDLLLRQSKRVEQVRAIFTTHAHGDHVNGLLSFADLLPWYYKKAATDIYLTEERLARAVVDYLHALEPTAFDADRVRISVVDGDFVYDDGQVRVSLIPTRHMEKDTLQRPSYAILLEAEGRRLLFTGDLSHKLAKNDFPAVALEEPMDLVVCELAHFSQEHLNPILERLQTKALWFNHVYPLKKLEEIETIRGAYPYDVEIAHDGDTLTL